MIVLAAFIVAVMVAVAVGILLSREPGYVLVSYGTTQVEFTLFVFILIYIAALLVGWGLGALARRFMNVRTGLRARRERRETRRAERLFTSGVAALAEGRFQAAERALERSARGPLTLPALIAAARAADLAGARERRDAYLRRADEASPRARSAVLFTQADLDLAHGDYERALAVLKRLQAESGEHPRALRDLARVYEALREYDALLGLLPELERKAKMPPAEIERLATVALAGALEAASADPDALRKRLPRNLRDSPVLRCLLARAWAGKGNPKRAAELLAHNLDEGCDAESVRAYAALSDIPTSERLRRIESWLRRYHDDPALHKEAGRIALEMRLWGQARNHLEAARLAGRDPEAALLAGRTAEQEGRQADAIAAYRSGLEAVAKPPGS